MKLLFLLALVLGAACASAQTSASIDEQIILKTAAEDVAETGSVAPADEEELRGVDLRQAAIVQSGSVDAMAALLHLHYTAHLANGHLSGREQTLGLVRSELLAREKFLRTQEKIIVVGQIGIVMGLDRLEAPPPLATRGERNRRYTNIYVRQGRRWKLLARHFHLMPDKESEALQTSAVEAARSQARGGNRPDRGGETLRVRFGVESAH